MMLPAAYDDELFYSVIARLGDRMGLPDAVALKQFTFGVSRVSPTIEIPPRLDLFLPRTLPGSIFTADAVVGGQSLFPYYASFLEAYQAEEARAAVCSGDAIRSFAKLGINTLQNTLVLRFCRGCVDDDRRNEREPYWRRRHQLPGVCVCDVHGMALHRGVSVRSREVAGFVSISRMLEEGEQTTPIQVDAPAELLASIATLSTALLDRPDELAGGALLDNFFRRLWTIGWRNGSRVASTDLMEEVRGRLGPDILAAIGVNHPRFAPLTDARNAGSSTDWLAKCLRVRGITRHPLPYVLIMAALGETVTALLAEVERPESEPMVLDGPCGNVVCPDADLPVPRPVEGADGFERVTIRCPICGFTYTQTPDASQARRKRIVDFGPLWDDALRKECERGDATKLELERRLGLDTYTIKRRALNIGVWHPRWGNETRKTVEEKESRTWDNQRETSRDRYRQTWLTLAKDNPEAGRRAIGRLDEVTYLFLRTYDADWLDETTPLVPRGRFKGRLDEESDAELAAFIRAAGEEIASVSPPRRITRNAIARSIGKSVIRLPEAKMPKSVQALIEISETEAEFALRAARHTGQAGNNDDNDGDGL